jgi:hypothetical protein
MERIVTNLAAVLLLLATPALADENAVVRDTIKAIHRICPEKINLYPWLYKNGNNIMALRGAQAGGGQSTEPGELARITCALGPGPVPWGYVIANPNRKRQGRDHGT